MYNILMLYYIPYVYIGMTCLMIACRYGHDECVSLLLRKGKSSVSQSCRAMHTNSIYMLCVDMYLYTVTYALTSYIRYIHVYTHIIQVPIRSVVTAYTVQLLCMQQCMDTIHVYNNY